MRASEPTGKRRYRQEKTWLGAERLILQIEKRYLRTYHFAGVIESEWNVGWFDATTADLTEHERL